MRAAINSFRGEAPRITPRALPDNAAQQATNARLLTGDLGAWRQFALEKALANTPGPVEAIYKLKDKWLSWTADVDVARGAVAGDATYRVFLTGPDVYDRPQWTNYVMATTGSEPYPAATRPLGVPGPEGSPTVTPGVDPNPTTFTVDIFDEGDQLATNWTASPDQFPHLGDSFVRQSAITGDPAPSYELTFGRNAGYPAYLYRNFGIAKLNVVRMSFDVMCVEALGGNTYRQVVAKVANTIDGAGIYIGWAENFAFGICSSAGWNTTSVSTLGQDPSSGVPAFNTWYTITVDVVKNFDATQTVTATLYQGSAQVATVTVTNSFDFGDYCGFVGETTADDSDSGFFTYYDNILVQGSGSTGYNPVDTATNYVYTYVNDIGEESAPSFASTTVLRPEGIAVTVSTPPDVPTGIDSSWQITTKRIYRAASGATGTYYRFVAEIPLAQTDYVDTLPDTELGELLQSELWALPPVGLRGLLALPNSVMAGFVGNQLCFSAQNHPHAWPVEYRLTVDTDIVAIGNIDTTVVIGTQAFPYLAIGTDPAAYSMTKLEVPQACVAKRSLAYLIGTGVVFASPDGLIAIAGNGNVRNLTSPTFTREQWQALAPETIIATAHDDVYHFWYGVDEETAFWLDTFDGTEGTGVFEHTQNVKVNGSSWTQFGETYEPILDGSGSVVRNIASLGQSGQASDFSNFGGTAFSLLPGWTFQFDIAPLALAGDTNAKNETIISLFDVDPENQGMQITFTPQRPGNPSPAITLAAGDAAPATYAYDGAQHRYSILVEADGVTMSIDDTPQAKLMTATVGMQPVGCQLAFGCDLSVDPVTSGSLQRVAIYGTRAS